MNLPDPYDDLEALDLIPTWISRAVTVIVLLAVALAIYFAWSSM